MFRLSKSFAVWSLVFCLSLLFCAGCNKKRIYTDPTPPGAHAPARAKTNANAPAPVSDVAKAQEVTSPTTGNEVAQAKVEPLQPVQLGSELPSETGPLAGLAGILDDELIGFPMADGSSYDATLLVAGHRSLPLGSKVEVTNVATGKRVVVTIVDRGPFDESRILDVSHAAARKLGMQGQSDVTLKVVGATLQPAAVTSSKTSTQPSQSTDVEKTALRQESSRITPDSHEKTPLGTPFYVQVGAFADEANAKEALQDLVQRGLPGSRLVRGHGSMTRVQAGPFTTRTTAEKGLDALRADYPASFMVIPD